jgi:hypothetical protein
VPNRIDSQFLDFATMMRPTSSLSVAIDELILADPEQPCLGITVGPKTTKCFECLDVSLLDQIFRLSAILRQSHGESENVIHVRECDLFEQIHVSHVHGVTHGSSFHAGKGPEEKVL